jgi:hypothetical protein
MAVQVGLIFAIVLSLLHIGGVVRGESPTELPNQSQEKSPSLSENLLSKKTQSSASHRVFVPIDAKKNPIGDKVYVPETLYQELYRRMATPTEKPQGWLILQAKYRGTLTADAGVGHCTLNTLHAQYDLQVFGRNARVHLPFSAEGANLLPNGALLDGRVIESEWDSEAASLVFTIAEPGEYRLELLLRPTIRNIAETTSFNVMIPRVSRSRLELAWPENNPTVEVLSACGEVREEKNSSRLMADIRPADRLVVRWHEGTTTASSSPAVDAEELIWLKIQPGSVIVNTKFKLHVVEGQIQQTQLTVDSRLRLLPLPGDDPPTVQPVAELDQLRTVAFRWPRPVSDRIVLEAGFLLGGASGVGNFRMPRIELLDARTTRRWMAVSVDPALDHDESQKQPFETVAVSDFLNAWGTSGVKPNRVYRLSSAECDWTLATRPHKPHSVADSQLTLSYDENRVNVLFEAKIATTQGYLFEHQITAPADLKIENISLMEEGVERVSRWSRNADGIITVFLNSAASDRQQLVLRGQTPIEMGKNRLLPQIHLEHCENHSSAISLSRHPSVLLKLPTALLKAPNQDMAMHIAPPRDTSTSTEEELGRFVAAFSSTGTPPISVTVEPNRPKIHSQEIVTIVQHEKTWNAKLDCHLSIRGGTVDQLMIRAPRGWNGPYRVSPPGQIQIREFSQEERRLVYRPETAMTEDATFSIQGLLDGERGGHPTIPDITLLQTENPERWYFLPSEIRDRPVRWQTRGLRPTSGWPKDVAASLHIKTAAYHVSGYPVQAILEPPETPRGSSFVRLADLTLAWQAGNRYSGTAVFDLEPEGINECPLQLPNECRWIAVLVEGIPVTPEAIGKGVWRLPLVSQRLTQRVEVLFHGTIVDNDRPDRHPLETPSLGELPVRQTVWTVIGPASWKAESQNGLTANDAWQQELMRWTNVTAAIESAATVLPDDPEALSRWRATWLRRFAMSKAAVQRELTAINSEKTNPNAVAARQKIDTFEQQAADLFHRLGIADASTQAVVRNPTAFGSGEIFRHLCEPEQAISRYVQEGRSNTLILVTSTSKSDGTAQRWFIAVGWILMTMLAMLGVANGSLIETIRRWPHVTITAIGLAWWLWLAPNILGVCILFAGLFDAIRCWRRNSTSY